MKLHRRMVVMKAFLILTLFVGAFGCGQDPPAPEPGFFQGHDAITRCFFEHRATGAWQRERTIQWSPDGSRVLFSTTGEVPWRESGTGPTIYAVGADAGRIEFQEIVDASGEVTLRGKTIAPLGTMTHFDVSPDGSRLVYSTCRYPTPPGEIDYRFYDDDSEWVLDHVRPSGTEVYVLYRSAEIRRYGYEIVVSNIDGTDPKRLTENEDLDNFPVWSPDGSRITFISDRRPYPGLYTMSPDGSDVRLVSRGASSDDQHPPSWSPDGRRLAFVAHEHFEEVHIVYTVGADGSGEARISESRSPPSWSPDGRRVALVAPEGDGAALYTFAADGSDPVRVVGIVDGVSGSVSESNHRGGESWPFWVGSVSWSPDGSEILVGLAIVKLDGSEPPRLVPILGPLGSWTENLHRLRTSWSPDGSKIAVRAAPRDGQWGDQRGNIPVLYTVDRDGTNPRVLVMDLIGESRPIAWDPVRPPADIEACSSGKVVPDPEGNPGLVEDCRVLLGMRDTLSGSGVLDWSSDTLITSWPGVEVDGDPLRVRGIRLSDSGLYGQIPRGIGSLTELRTLNMDGNGLNGPIPAELDKLNLETVSLWGNQFTGSVWGGKSTNTMPLELRDLENRDR